MRVEVGKVGRPHGLEGAFVVEQASDDPDRFAEGTTLLVDGEPAQVVESKRAAGRPDSKFDSLYRFLEKTCFPDGPDVEWTDERVIVFTVG